MQRVQRELEAAGAKRPRANFTCALALAAPGRRELQMFEGKVFGTLVWPPRGTRGFGYDPIFVPEGYKETFGEMEPERRTAISHRARAFEKLMSAAHDRMNEPFGVYVHWPFCLAKCPYCDFNSHVRHGGIDQGDVRRCLSGGAAAFRIARAGAHRHQHLLRRRHAVADAARDGRRDPRSHRRHCGAIEPDAEITLEANPTIVEAENFAGYRAAGVNRVSLGVQALDDASLKALGRQHTAKRLLPRSPSPSAISSACPST